MEALASLEGVKSEGWGAHRKLIDWVADRYDLKESDRLFLQRLRGYRNQINYEGFSINPSFLKRNLEKINRLFDFLEKKTEEELNL